MDNKPRIGDIVYFLRYGLSDNPTVAIVVASFSEDLIDLSVWDTNRWMHMQAIQRQGCAAVKNNPTMAQQRGTWDFRDPPEVRNAINELVYGSKKSAAQVPPKE